MHIFFISALVGGEWLASLLGHFTLWEGAPDTHWKRGWVGTRPGLDVVKKRKSCPYRDSNPRRPPCSPSLYRLSYPDFSEWILVYLNHYVVLGRYVASDYCH
jgi:hypothetical protein